MPAPGRVEAALGTGPAQLGLPRPTRSHRYQPVHRSYSGRRHGHGVGACLRRPRPPPHTTATRLRPESGEPRPRTRLGPSGHPPGRGGHPSVAAWSSPSNRTTRNPAADSTAAATLGPPVGARTQHAPAPPVPGPVLARVPAPPPSRPAAHPICGRPLWTSHPPRRPPSVTASQSIRTSCGLRRVPSAHG